MSSHDFDAIVIGSGFDGAVSCKLDYPDPSLSVTVGSIRDALSRPWSRSR